MSEWKEYNGSDEHIAEMHYSILHGGYALKYRDGWTTPPLRDIIEIDGEFMPEFQPTHYLICNPHPLADMICQQARTGQPVWVMVAIDMGIGEWENIKYTYFRPTNTPDWNIPNAEYSFTEFKEEV